MKVVNTNWYVITGGPCSGKTTVIDYLSFLGHKTVPEVARSIINAEVDKGKTIEEIRANDVEFQKNIFQIKIENENKLSPEKDIFIDGAVACSIAHYQIVGLDPAPIIAEAKKRKYKKIFFLEPILFKKDYARIEDEKMAERIGQMHYKAYSNLGYNVIRVPVIPIKERINFILNKIQLS
ncbi:MAG: ATP-binding protein [Candidatus Nealsonbacteria bacterium]|nr:ATP-binding protein [Candidatus Nealsonbacteria bacterium]